jgi:hypothetical protein
MFDGQDTLAPDGVAECQLTHPSRPKPQHKLRRRTGSFRFHRNGRLVTERPATGPVAPSIPCYDMPQPHGLTVSLS